MSDVGLQKLATQIKAARKQSGLTQKETAERAGISPNHYAQIEQGNANPSYTLLEKIAKALGTDLIIPS